MFINFQKSDNIKLFKFYWFVSVVNINVIVQIILLFFFLIFWCFNANFSNISAISWRPVLVVEDAGVPGEN